MKKIKKKADDFFVIFVFSLLKKECFLMEEVSHINSNEALVVSFPCIFQGPFYEYARACLELACRSSPRVFVCLRFSADSVSFAQLQSLLIHIYSTISEEANSSCAVVVIDPSVGQTRVLSELPWKQHISGGSPCIWHLREEQKKKKNIDWPNVPNDYEAQFSFFRHSVAVLSRVAHGVNGGTFDHLHNGHRLLLSASAAVCSVDLTVGITSDTMIANSKKSLKELVEPYAKRRDSVAAFLHLCNPDLKSKLPAIDDAFGPSITDASLEVIIVSEETVAGGAAVNEKRVQANLKSLTVLSVDCWDRHSGKEGSIATKISSTDARKRLAKAGSNL